MTCGTCGHTNHARAKFCDQCGAPLTQASGSTARETTPRGAPVTPDSPPSTRGASAPSLPGTVDGEHKYVTVLFADVRGSMALAEKLGPEKWRALLDRFVRILNDGVHRFDGTVNQYTGDGVMALFGAPIALEDHARRACLAAIALRDRLRAFAADLEQARGIDFAVRIGLHSGDVVVGTIGDDLRQEYTAQGHAVGIAQRIEQLATPNAAFVSQVTAGLVSGYFDVRDAGEFHLKGVSEPVRVYELERARRARTRLEAAPARRRSRFIGRSAELASLVHAVDEAVAGRGAVIGVVGEPGVGKTRLCSKLLLYARARGMMLARAHCSAYAADVSLLPILDLLRSFFRLREGEGADASRRKIQGRLRKLSRSCADQAPLALEFLGVAEGPGVSQADEDARRQQRFAFVRRLIQTQSAARPLLLFIDDVHCIDTASDSFLGEIVDALGWTRTLLLINYRPSYRADWMRGSYWRELALATLGDADVDQLLLGVVGSDPSTATLRRTIRERTGGNPLFVEEVVQSLLDHGVLAPVDAADNEPRAARRIGSGRAQPPLRVVGTPDEQFVPPTVQALLAARIDRLAYRERLVVHAASVIGQSFSAEVLCHVLAAAHTADALTADDVQQALGALEQGAFVHRERTPSAADYRFKHPLTQAVAYATHLAESRTQLHLATARALQHIHADCLGQHAGLIGHHYGAGGWTYEAARWQKRAALQVTNITLPRKWRQ